LQIRDFGFNVLSAIPPSTEKTTSASASWLSWLRDLLINGIADHHIAKA
jgi:hypothetical protein